MIEDMSNTAISLDLRLFIKHYCYIRFLMDQYINKSNI